jgi:hypothetical protein
VIQIIILYSSRVAHVPVGRLYGAGDVPNPVIDAYLHSSVSEENPVPSAAITFRFPFFRVAEGTPYTCVHTLMRLESTTLLYSSI